MSPRVHARGVDRLGIYDVIMPTLDGFDGWDSWDGIGAGFVFWSRYPEIESRITIYAGLFCLNLSSIPGYA